MSKTYPDLTGYIFERNGYWKITGPAQRLGYYAGSSFSFPVVKCTKHGKEFSRRDGYGADTVMQLHLQGLTVKCGLTEDVKVSTDGKASGARKRRIKHLEAELASILKEVNGLLQQEKAPYEHKLTVVDIQRS